MAVQSLYETDEEQLRDSARGFLARYWPPDKALERAVRPEALQEFWQRAAAQGWTSLGLDAEAGGLREVLVLLEELGRDACPVLMAYGSPEQQQRFLPAFLQGKDTFCLGYSEPEAGSDLASLRTTATRDETGWVINGTKIYTTMGDLADYVWLAARTDPDAPVKHAGISVFLVPTNTPGITIRPDIALYGHPACTVFYDNVHVPEDALVGQVNGGWRIITSALASERVLMGGIVAGIRAYFDQLATYLAETECNGRPLRQDPLVRGGIGSLAADLEAARMLLMQSIELVSRGQVPFHQAAMTKVFTGELGERLPETALELLVHTHVTFSGMTR